jgi:predicted dehydrogenase
MSFNIAIVGAGLIGRKRALALKRIKEAKLTVIVDVVPERAESLAREFDCNWGTEWQKVISRNDIDIVIVATVNKYLAEISIRSLENKKHVLCEKPLGRNVEESLKILKVSIKNKVVLKVGFNHRFHPAIEKAKEIVEKGEIGKIMFFRCRYGHGGRSGYEREWRANKELCGGGELLDQGVHVVDLFRWFAGEFDEVLGYTPTFFWKMKVEDNAFAFFKKRDGVIAFMHTSWTQWKNLFSFEIFGEKGYLIINGLGGSYGKEVLKIGRRKEEGGIPEEKIIEFESDDISWQKELIEFFTAIEEGREPIGSGYDGYKANLMIEAVYKSAKESSWIKIKNE